MKNEYRSFLVCTALVIISCTEEQSILVPAPEKEIILTDSFEIEFAIINAVFNVPEIRHRIKEKEKRHPNTSSTNAGFTERPGHNGNTYYTVVVEDLADDDSTWYNLAVFHVYYPPMTIFYFDTLQQKELSREEWQRDKEQYN